MFITWIFDGEEHREEFTVPSYTEGPDVKDVVKIELTPEEMVRVLNFPPIIKRDKLTTITGDTSRMIYRKYILPQFGYDTLNN